ncbi:type II secretion system F family protein [Campylobacter insulaenigrae]|uniref:type II secretion system F family protein n=1 Tax=Campylobacter insulaenigrae TaxID=260714 RepID=UPI002152F98B|nr:type II secretion system F family protein [Campylobacter insulaenigrae]MCR6576761.1 type II secretion system F family protein [Campylobacter insulaenigrae]
MENCALKCYVITYLLNKQEKQIVIKAKNLYEARIKASEQYEFLVDIKEYCNEKQLKIKEEELIFLLKDLKIILNAGFSLQEAILEFCQNSYDRKITNIFYNIFQKLKNGLSYEESFKDILNSRELAILKICEGKQDLSKAFEIIISLKEKNLKNIRQFKKAISYPILVFASIIFAFFVLMFFVLPEFRNLFIQLNLELPTITKILFFVGDFLTDYLLFVVIFIAVCFLWIYILLNKTFVFDKILIFMPILGKIIMYQDKFCFFIILSYLLNSGVDIKKALKLSSEGVKNNFLKIKITHAIVLFESGVDLAQAFSKIKIFESFVIRMLSLSLKSSKIDDSSYDLAIFFEYKKEEYVQKIFSILEPLLIIFMASMILILALGIFLPMWQISQGI